MRPVLGNFTQGDFGDFGESDLTKYLKGGGRGGEPMGKSVSGLGERGGTVSVLGGW